MLDANGTFETNGKDNNNLPTNIRVPFPPSYGRSLGFGGQPLPPSLRPHFPSEYSSSLLSATSNHLSSSSGKDEPRLRHSSKSPEPLRSRSPKSNNNRPLEIERAHDSHENQDNIAREGVDGEQNEHSRTTSTPIASKDNNGLNENEVYNCDGPRQERKKETLELSSLLPSNSENTSKISAESIAT